MDLYRDGVCESASQGIMPPHRDTSACVPFTKEDTTSLLVMATFESCSLYLPWTIGKIIDAIRLFLFWVAKASDPSLECNDLSRKPAN